MPLEGRKPPGRVAIYLPHGLFCWGLKPIQPNALNSGGLGAEPPRGGGAGEEEHWFTPAIFGMVGE